MHDFSLIKFESVNRPLAEARQMYEQRLNDARVIYEKHHQDFLERDCPFCGASEYESREPFHDTYGVARCGTCGGLYVNPAPNMDALLDYYNNSPCNRMLQALYKRRTAGKRSFIMDDRVANVIEHIRAVMTRRSDPVRILEIGCGSGRFLANMKGVLEEQGLAGHTELAGVDIDRNAVDLNDDEDLQLHGEPFEKFVQHCDDRYDVVLHFELIEHLADPFAFMQRCRELLRPSGIMVFTTPNANGCEMVASGYNGFRLIAHGIFPPMHLNAFTTHNVGIFLLRAGFRIGSITTPGNLDADMVSVMSEHLEDPGFSALARWDDEHKGVFQYLLQKLAASSHMMVVARRSTST